jgi:hypothetical protein
MSKQLIRLALCAAVVAMSVQASAQPPPPKAKGIESEGYVWNEEIGEKM